jgi:RNA polymerase sigma-70 factor (sigma-E family)
MRRKYRYGLVCNLMLSLAHLLSAGMPAWGGAGMPAQGRPPWRSDGYVTAEGFVEFAEAASPRLRRMAFLLCGDWHTAEDLLQTTLAKVFVSWHKIRRQDAVYAYATRTLVNTYLADKRQKRAGEVLTSRLPDRLVEAPAPETRMVVVDALAALPPGGRAVVVLRYWADLSVEQTAAALGCSPGNVKSQSARALDKLRVLLGEAMADSGPPASLREERHETGDARHG